MALDLDVARLARILRRIDGEHPDQELDPATLDALRDALTAARPRLSDDDVDDLLLDVFLKYADTTTVEDARTIAADTAIVLLRQHVQTASP